MTRKLDVFLGRDKIGMLEQDRHGALWFAYDGAWLENEHAVACFGIFATSCETLSFPGLPSVLCGIAS